MRKLTLLVCILLAGLQLFAQNRTITGRITDANGNALPAITITVPGTKGKAVSLQNGEFTIAVPAGSRTLSFSSVGFETKTVTLDQSDNVIVTLTASTASLDDVVVTGYARVKKSQYAGAATIVDKEKINNVPNASFDQILQGRAPGILVTVGSGQPGASARVQIRGQSSISGGSDPLYIVDGMPIEAGNFRSINPNDFENVQVLKDAVATAQYGNRGSAGVIVITTKKGSNSKPALSYSFQEGITQPGKEKFDMMTTAELLQFQEILGLQVDNGLPGWVYSSKNPAYAASTPDMQAQYAKTLDSLRNINTNWKDVFERQGNFQSHDLSLSGGTGNTRFYLNGGYYDEQGIGLRSDLKRYSIRANIDHRSDKLTLSFSSGAGYTHSDFIESEGGVALANPFAAAYLALPYQKLYNPDGSVATGSGHTGANAYERVVNGTVRNNNQIKVTTSLNVSYDIVRHVYIGGFLGLDYRQTVSETSTLPGSYAANTAGFPTGPDVSNGDTIGRGFYAPGYNNSAEYITRAFVGYKNVFSDVHDVDVQLISEYTHDYLKGFNYTGYGIDSKLLGTPAGITPGDLTNKLVANTGGFKDERALYAAMILGRYTYMGKYTLNASFRRDATSQLAPNNRFQNFYAAGVSWNVLKEGFASNWNKVNDLRVRISYGESANSDGFYSGFYGYLATYGGGSSYAGRPTTYPSSPGNPDLTWERIKTLNAGVDFSFFSSRVKGSIDVYNKKTSNNIIPQQLSYTSGFSSLDINAGTVVNKGVELNLSLDILKTKDFTWNVGGNVSYNHNEVTNLNQVSEYEQGTELVKVGLPLGSHYIVKWGGVDAATGRPLYYTKDGKLTTTYSDDDRVSDFGTYNAPWIGGFNTGIYYKGLSLEAFFTFQQGFSRFNNQDYFQLNHAFALAGYNVRQEMLTIWQRPGDVTNIQAPVYQREFTSKDIQDASFTRFRNLTFGYSFGTKVISALKVVGALRIYVQGQNLYTWTNWVGFDPEDNNNIASYEYPTPRTFTAGLTVTFK